MAGGGRRWETPMRQKNKLWLNIKAGRCHGLRGAEAAQGRIRGEYKDKNKQTMRTLSVNYLAKWKLGGGGMVKACKWAKWIQCDEPWIISTPNSFFMEPLFINLTFFDWDTKSVRLIYISRLARDFWKLRQSNPSQIPVCCGVHFSDSLILH